MSPAEFCREIEAYLCRKNEGHLIRIVGPVFTTVTGWAEQGIPLNIACRGIDRFFDRAKRRPRRRPVPIQFCEADILDSFDEWRRALGLSATAARSLARPTAEDGGGEFPAGTQARSGSGAASESGGASGLAEFGSGVSRTGAPAEFGSSSDTHAEIVPIGHARRKAGLQVHIDRVMARLTQRRVEVGGASALGDVIDRMLGQLDALRGDAKGLRGDARERVVAALGELDRQLLEAAAAGLDEAGGAAVRAEAGRDLEAFRSRMPAEAFARAEQAARDRVLRERLRLPIVRVDE